MEAFFWTLLILAALYIALRMALRYCFPPDR